MGNQIKKKFTPDHRRNYTMFNSSNIFSTDISQKIIEKSKIIKEKTLKEKEKIKKFQPKYNNPYETAFSRKLNETNTYSQNTLNKAKSINCLKNSTLGFLKTEFT